ncbi:MAG: D-2-hydroxyacid dehydrogenase [Colwellia sp.]|nr:D-2-hydroxyacid dehydrogenase [Colwellia sp.]
MHAVFLDLQTFSANVSLDCIKAQVTAITCYQTTTQSQILTRCKNADIIITNKVELTADLLKQLPQLSLICIAATGTNNVDSNAAAQLAIAVTNVSGYANNSVAQYVFSQICHFYSQTQHHHKNTEQGLWQTSDTFCYHGKAITEIAGKTLGIIGYGSLGKSVAKIAQAFEMKVLIAERKNSKTIRANRTSLQQVIEQSDILSLHCPQTPETTQLVNEQFLTDMKSTAMLINSARGALIDNQALLMALQQQQISYAVLDVLDQEPPPADHLLLTSGLTNLKITAHIAWASTEAQQKLLDIIAKNIKSFNNNQQLNRIN